ncbi:S10 family peptidase [Asticcacaulis sp. 201]|uniref:S10 family peptidase n=1 Tax=Asticcacaulis sp. 201 TaxID=3028787 RepID=UPI00291604CD|nr:alpha/beta hydrolase fold domain-containing protein [Asticcacaulis sp. 201]MDV6332950.1 alpha/beta hydrolase fold domain-containing protein [Asticcacaulis sp. 201]
MKSGSLVPLIACMTLMTAVAPALAETAPIVTHHVLKTGKTPLAYDAAFTETELKNASGQPVVTLSAISYVLDGVKDDTKRPVMFFFNGGPGASSSPLHMSAFGPRIRSEGKNAHIIDNPNTLLDSADLVFIDPVGTGLSRTFRPDEVGQFLGVNHDAAAVLTVITNWLKSNNREASPIFIAGESYGGARLAVIAGQMVDQKTPIHLKGLLLISPALDFSTSADMTQVLQLPTLAAGAWYHRKVDRKQRSLADVVASAQNFSINTYAPALIKGAALSENERAFVAKELADFTGISADLIANANLRIDSDVFLSNLNAAQNLDTGRLDMRVTAIKAPPLNADRSAAANDPSLGLGKSNVITSPLITAYLHDELKVPVTSDYVSLSLDLNFRWNWSDVRDEQKFALNVTPELARLMKDRPGVRMMVVGGYYDLATPLWSARYAIEHSDAPLDRVRFEAYPTGHSVFNPADDLSAKADQIRTFLTPQP